MPCDETQGTLAGRRPGRADTSGNVIMVTVVVAVQVMKRAIATYWQAVAAQT
jgi:hypothetical protein